MSAEAFFYDDDCPYTQKISSFYNQTLDARQSSSMLGHIKHCSTCRNEKKREESIGRKIMRFIPNSAPTEDVEKSIREEMHKVSEYLYQDHKTEVPTGKLDKLIIWLKRFLVPVVK